MKKKRESQNPQKKPPFSPFFFALIKEKNGEISFLEKRLTFLQVTKDREGKFKSFKGSHLFFMGNDTPQFVWNNPQANMVFERKPQLAFKDSMIHKFCNSHYLSHFATFFIDTRAKRSTGDSCYLFFVFCFCFNLEKKEERGFPVGKFPNF